MFGYYFAVIGVLLSGLLFIVAGMKIPEHDTASVVLFVFLGVTCFALSIMLFLLQEERR